MSNRRAPEHPKIYHITHVDNLIEIIKERRLYSDKEMVAEAKAYTKIGMSKLKHDRFNRPVKCHPGTFVSDYVPFYFCPRSPMLYIAWRQNHGEVHYKGGQDAIVHLEADFNMLVAAAAEKDWKWAVSLSNAASMYAEFRTGPGAVDELPWDCIEARQWAGPIQDRKQAEFLFHRRFPWKGITRLGVRNATVHQRVRTLLEKSDHKPPVEVRPDWYY